MSVAPFIDADSIRINIDAAAVHALLASEHGPVFGVVERACIAVQGAASRTVHVVTGRLRASIDYVVTSDSRGLVGFVGSNVEYALYEELRHPYLRPALSAAAAHLRGA